MKLSIDYRPLIALGLGLGLFAPLAAHAEPAAELHGYIVGGAANTAGFYYSRFVDPATSASSITKTLSDIGRDGSYANGKVDVGFGSLHSYSDAHEVNTGGGAPQTSASSEFIDYIKPWESSPVGVTAYTLTLAVNGTHSATDPYGARPGYAAQGSVRYDIRDNQNGDVFASGFFDSSDAVPSTTLIKSIVVPLADATDDMRIDVSLDTFAYVSNLDPAFQTAFADYSHTLVVNLDAVTAGASTTGVSGFDYATVSSVPDPSTWLLLVAGIGALRIVPRGKSAAAARGLANA